MDAMVKVQVLRAACCVAGADGLTEPAERAIVEKLAKEVGVGDASIQAMLERATTEPDYVKDQFRVLKAEPENTMRLLISVAASDQQLEDAELAVLRQLGDQLGMESTKLDQLIEEAQGS